MKQAIAAPVQEPPSPQPGKEVRDVHDRVEPPSHGVTAEAMGGDAAERKRRKNIGDYYAQMMDAQAQCVPCRLCGGKAVITDAGPGFGYTIECENAARFRKPTCLQSGTRISGWAYNVSDLWNRLNATPAPVVPAEGLEDYDAGLLNDFGGGDVGWWQDYLRAEIGRANEFWRDQVSALRSAPPVGARVTDWQPIGTAPSGVSRNGKFGVRWMMLAIPHEDGGYNCVSGMRVGDKFFACLTFYCGGPFDGKQYVLREVEVLPTHWMPLLEPPAALLPAGEGEE